MKKVILIVAMVFATSSLVNANNNQIDEVLVFSSCADDAWAYGTIYGGGDEMAAYEGTDYYYSTYC